MFNNPFYYQYRFDYFKTSDNEDDEMWDPNLTINVDDDVDDE
jgi:hypothetical protein